MSDYAMPQQRRKSKDKRKDKKKHPYKKGGARRSMNVSLKKDKRK